MRPGSSDGEMSRSFALAGDQAHDLLSDGAARERGGMKPYNSGIIVEPTTPGRSWQFQLPGKAMKRLFSGNEAEGACFHDPTLSTTAPGRRVKAAAAAAVWFC